MTNQWQNITRHLQTIEDDIRSSAPRSSGALADSVAAQIERSDNGGFSVIVSMLDYGIYQDKGVNGTERSWGSPFSYRDKMPPSSAFANYTSNSGEQFAIAKSIYRNGIQPRNFIEPALDRGMDELANFAAEDLWDWFYQQNK
jgi:hypothetical protein